MCYLHYVSDNIVQYLRLLTFREYYILIVYPVINDFIKVGFCQKVMAKFSNLSNRHTCEPKIVPEQLFPVHVVNRIFVLF